MWREEILQPGGTNTECHKGWWRRLHERACMWREEILQPSHERACMWREERKKNLSTGNAVGAPEHLRPHALVA
jgi:hypothetical protein